MKVKQIISTHKRIKKSQPLQKGYKRVMAIMENSTTRHIDIPS